MASWLAGISLNEFCDIEELSVYASRGFVGLRASSDGDLAFEARVASGARGFLIASVRDFMVVLATSVASMYLSRGARTVEDCFVTSADAAAAAVPALLRVVA